MFRQQQHQNYTFITPTVWLVVILMVPVLAWAQVETGKPPSTPFPQQPEVPKKEYTVPPLPLPNPPNPFKVEEREQQKRIPKKSCAEGYPPVSLCVFPDLNRTFFDFLPGI